MESFIELSIPSLLEWKKWTSTSKAFLAAQGDAVNLRPVVAKHGELILTFNTVFFNDLEAANATHLDGLNELVTERNALLAGIPIEDARRVTESWTRRRNGEDVPIPGFGAPLFGSAPSDPQ